MEFFLSLIVILLLCGIFYFNFQFIKDKKKFQEKVTYLENIIVEISKEQVLKNNQLQLSDDLRQKIKTINSVLNKDIFDLNYELFDQLSKNK